MLICSVFTIVFFPVTELNDSGISLEESLIILIPILLDRIVTMLLIKLMISFSLFCFFYLKIVKERTYYLKPLFFSLLLNLLVIIDIVPLLKEDQVADENFTLMYFYIYATAVLIYLSIFSYHLLKNRKQQHKFEWTKEKDKTI